MSVLTDLTGYLDNAFTPATKPGFSPVNLQAAQSQIVVNPDMLMRINASGAAVNQGHQNLPNREGFQASPEAKTALVTIGKGPAPLKAIEGSDARFDEHNRADMELNKKPGMGVSMGA